MRRIAADDLRYWICVPIALLLVVVCYSGERLEKLLNYIDPRPPP